MLEFMRGASNTLHPEKITVDEPFRSSTQSLEEQT